MRAVDIHVITDTSDMHTTPWSSQWMKVYRDSISSENPVMDLQLGTSHSVAVCGKGKAYAWGWNDNGQCSKDPNYVDEVIIKENSKVAIVNFDQRQNPQQDNDKLRVKQVFGEEDRCFVLTQDSNDLLAWGANEKGQLGFGHYTDVY